MMILGIGISAQLQLGSGTSTSGSSEAVPWSNYYKFSYCQQIIKKSELNTSAGNITGLKFFLGSSRTLLNSDEIIVYLGHTSDDTFASTTSWIPLSSLTEVFAGTVTNNSGVVEITFTTPFAYNNVDNLVVAIDENKDDYDTAGGSTEYFYKYSVASNSTLYYRNDNTNPDPANPTITGSRVGTRAVMQILGLVPASAPACNTISAPTAGATGVSVTPALTWSAADGATSYLVSLGTTPGGTDVMNGVDVGLVTSYTIPAASQLSYLTTYYLTVSPKNAAGVATGCTERSFTTRNIPCPSVSAPSASATGVSITPTFTWSAAADATGYKISIGTTAGGSDILDNFDVGNVTTYTYNSPLNFNTKYYYTINSYNATLNSSGCSERSFTTATLCPSVTAPTSSATNVSITPTITWGAITGATGYRISMGTTAGGTDIMNNVDVGNVVSYTLSTPLAFSTKYYYTVTGYAGTTSGTACSERSFTTQGACPVVTYPAASATLQPVTPTIKWNAISTATYYTLTVGTTAGGSDIMNNVNVGNVTTYTFTTPLTLGTKYYYTVNTDTSSGCTERSFTVNSVAAPANDNCLGALVASSFPYSYSQTDGAGSTNGSGFVLACGTGSNDGLWFKFTGDGGDITVKATTTNSWDHKVSVYAGSCDALTCVGSADSDYSSTGAIETYTFTSVAGTDYYVNVAYYSGTSDSTEGNFNINITTTNMLATSEVSKEKVKEIKVYPNPFTDVLNISDASKVKSVSVIDLTGRLVKTIEDPSSALQLRDLKEGMYLVVLNMKDGTKQTVKAIKK